MTDQQTDLREDRYVADDVTAEPLDWSGDDYDESPIGYDDDPTFDALLDEWDGAYIAAAPRTPPQDTRTWYRDPRWLFGLIALAAAALVVATVLLVTGRGSGEIPTAPGLTTRVPASSTSAPSPSSAPSSPSASSDSSSTTATSSTSSTSSAPEAPGVAEAPEPQPPLDSADESAPPASSQEKSPTGPRINVTRTPMSFSPGKH